MYGTAKIVLSGSDPNNEIIFSVVFFGDYLPGKGIAWKSPAHKYG